MGLAEKIAGAKKSNWLTEGLNEAEVKTSIELAKISARIERSRLEMGMTQAEFSEYMGVSQGMVSKWESGEYNFTIKTLNEICQKLNLNLSVSVEKHCANTDYKIVRWEKDHLTDRKRNYEWIRHLPREEAIA